MDFKSYSFPRNVKLRVLSAEVILEGGVSDKMWFKAGEALHLFSKQEFILIIGLKFSLMNIDITDLERMSLLKDDIVTNLFSKAKKNRKVYGL